jgi:hypothetical protein
MTMQSGEFGEQPMNVGNIERLVSMLAGAIGLLLLSRRLFVYVTLALVSAYLVFRGVTGRCALYNRANINTRSEDDITGDLSNDLGSALGTGTANVTSDMRAASPADRIGAGESEDSEIERWMERERAMDPVEQASWESFPASDPPGLG